MFVLVVLLLHGYVWGSIRVHMVFIENIKHFKKLNQAMRYEWVFFTSSKKSVITEKRFDLLQKKKGMRLNCIWWWGSTSGDMWSVEYPFIAINPRFTLIRCGSTFSGPIYESDLFKIHSYLTETFAKNISWETTQKMWIWVYDERDSLTSSH